MANEIQLFYKPNKNVYVLLFNADGDVWSVADADIVTFVGADRADYAITLTAEPAGSPDYMADFPVGITTAGTYQLAAYFRAGASPASSDRLIAEGQVVWGGTSGEEEPALAAPSGDNLVSLAYVKAYLGIVTTDYDVLLASLIAAASKAISNRTRRTFQLKMYVEDYAGNDDYTLQLKHVPVTSLSSVTLNAYDTSPEEVDGDDYCYDGATGQIELKPSSNATAFFPSGRGVKHTVSYQAGFAPIPADIQQAAAMVTQGLFLQRGQTQPIKSESLGDYSVTYRDAHVFISQSVDVQQIIDRYTDWT